MEKDLKIIVMENAKELGNKINEHLKKLNGDKNYILNVSSSRFSNGEGKVRLEDSVRDKDIYILSDVGNYSISYEMHGRTHYMSPDEHFQDIKRVISATSGHAGNINLVMPLLYQARQHKRKGSESLDCAIALQELEKLGVKEIVTFDAHDPNVSNAIPNLPFDNFYPTHEILNTLLEKDSECLKNIMVVSPDMGAMERARYYAEMLNSDVGVFYKRRDLSKVINGKNPIVEHVYMGSDVKDKNIIVVDDMIATGSSMIDVAAELKTRGANKVYLVATFALLTEGTNKFNKAFVNGYFDKLYSTNLSYVPKEFKNETWYEEVDCSYYVAEIIHSLHRRESLKPLHHSKEKLLKRIKEVIYEKSTNINTSS